MITSSYQEHVERAERRKRQLQDTLASLFAEETALTLEIGCGHGHWLVDYAAQRPERTCLGIDLVTDRIARAAKKADRAGLSNAIFLKGEAMELLDLMPPSVTLEEVFMLFPDPWPKKRHWKNRLFSAPFLRELASRCRPGVRFHFRSDHQGYCQWASEVVASQRAWQLDAAAEWPFERATVFQERAETFQSLILVRT